MCNRAAKIVIVCFFLLACSKNSIDSSAFQHNVTEGRTVVVFLGDSLTAGYGLNVNQAYPARISQRWQREGINFQTRNAGINGDTSAGALKRLDRVLLPDIHTVFLAIGANDGLRSLPIVQLRQNLIQIIEKIRAKGILVVMAGMRVPIGPTLDYPKQFRQTYEQVAKEHNVPLLSFLLKDVIARPELNLADAIHPNAQGQQIIADNVFAFLKKQGFRWLSQLLVRMI